MPELKISRTAAECFKKAGTDRSVRDGAYKPHILTKKSTKRKRSLRKDIVTDATNLRVMRKILPYLQVELQKEEIPMARVKGGLDTRKKYNRVLKMIEGYRDACSKQYRVAKQFVTRTLTSSYAGRKGRRRQFRQLWIARINAAVRINGLSYSKLMYGLKLAGVDLNHKVLSDMTINDAEGFAKLAELAKFKTA